MTDENTLLEPIESESEPDPDEIPIRDRKLATQPYDLAVDALVTQIKSGTIFLRPLSERPTFQRKSVWPKALQSRLLESILLNVPIPQCYLSQNNDFELDVIDGQQRLLSIYMFVDNQIALSDLTVLTEINGSRFYELPSQMQRKIRTHTLRCVVITNESHPEIKFDVFQRLNSNTVPLNAQELRNCVYRGTLNELLHDVVAGEFWLKIFARKQVDKRMRDEELALRFFAFWNKGLQSYRTPQKLWLNDAAEEGMKFSETKIQELRAVWDNAIATSLIWFEPGECFRRMPFNDYRSVNRALFDLTMISAAHTGQQRGKAVRTEFRRKYASLLKSSEFADLISRAVDHTKRTKRRFELWDEMFRTLA